VGDHTTPREAALMPDKTGLWGALGTPKAVRIISIGMLVYFFVIGGLVVGYSKVSNCIAEYADQSARSTAARAAAAAEDRRLDKAEGKLEDSDRARLAADQAALTAALQVVMNPDADRSKRAGAFASLLEVNEKTTRVLAANAEQREQIRLERAQVEAERQRNPVPAPPSETC
jgi:hypothetical protein